jgi:hypothetical protein
MRGVRGGPPRLFGHPRVEACENDGGLRSRLSGHDASPFCAEPDRIPAHRRRAERVANRALGDWMLLRIDDTDATRNVPGGEEAILRDLEWLGIDWDERARTSERACRAAPRGGRRAAAALRRRDVVAG